MARYFNATPSVKFAMLTKGIEYKFFTDFNETNIMDETPFLVVNMLNLTDFEIEALSKFRVDSFNVNDLQAFSMNLIYGSTLIRKLTEIFEDPPDAFIRYLIRNDCVKTRITQPVIERFKPLVKSTLASAIAEHVQKHPDYDLARSASLPEPVTGKRLKTLTQPEAEAEVHPAMPSPDDLAAFSFVHASLDGVARDTSTLAYHCSPESFIICLADPENWFVKLLPGNPEQRQVILNLPFYKTDKMISAPIERRESPDNSGASIVVLSSPGDYGPLKRAVITAYDLMRSSM